MAKREVNSGSFKKGHRALHSRHNGNPYLYCRTTKDGYHQKRWLIHYNGKQMSYLVYLCNENGIKIAGRIPRLREGFNIENKPEFKDIILLTKKENMLLNTANRFPEGLRKLTHAKAVLTRQIKKYEKRDTE